VDIDLAGSRGGGGGAVMATQKLEPPYDVEAMAVADLEAVIEIEGASFARPSTPQLLLEEMARDWAFLDVVRDRGDRRVVAFTNYWVVADEVHLLNLATHPRARRAGHASRLLAHVIAYGREHRCRFVTLEVRRSNADALRLYKRFGFRPVGVRPGYYAENQEDAIVMLLGLA
jgi:[ribosomal protein S18]-alanine N-acetyltransferase